MVFGGEVLRLFVCASVFVDSRASNSACVLQRVTVVQEVFAALFD